MKYSFFQRQKLLAGKEAQRGFLSVEAIVVLIIVIGLMALGASKMDMLTGNSEANEEISNIQAMVTSTKSLKSSSGYGTSGSDLTPTLIAIGGVPKNIAVVGGVLQNSVGGVYSVASTGPGFSISSSGMSTALCVKTATKLSKSGLFATTKIGSGSATAGEVNSQTAGTACAAGNVTITFTIAT